MMQLTPNARQPLTNLGPGDVQPVVIVCGDKDRALKLAEICTSYTIKSKHLDYHAYEGVIEDGQKITIISHGIGTQSSHICFEELICLGAKVIIRVGTCGSMKPETFKQGDIIIGYAAAPQRPVDSFIPVGMPCVADMDLVRTLQASSEELNVKTTYGIFLSTDYFYGRCQDKFKAENIEWGKFVDAVEMEVAQLFACSRARGISAGSICVVDGSPLAWDQQNYDPTGTLCTNGKMNSLKVALHTCAKLRRKYAQ